MSLVKHKHTKPELFVRSLVHRLGFRFRLHDSRLAGKPDLVLKRLRKVIFVHGCFWHRHGKCRELSIPTNNPDFWKQKFAENKRRDMRNIRAIRSAGWGVLVVWECEIKHPTKLQSRIVSFLTR